MFYCPKCNKKFRQQVRKCPDCGAAVTKAQEEANMAQIAALFAEFSMPITVVMGNHDHYVSSRQNLADFNPHAAAVVEWTRKQLSMEEIRFLRDLPFKIPKKLYTSIILKG